MRLQVWLANPGEELQIAAATVETMCASAILLQWLGLRHFLYGSCCQ